MPVDYHLHTKMCGHATGEMEEYLAAASKRGLTEIGFADHLPLYFLPSHKTLSGYAMQMDELPVYVAAVRHLQGMNKSVNIKLGVEADFVPGYERELANLLRAHPFDYVLGSVHFIDGWSFDNQEEIEQYNRWDIGELYEKYFSLVRQAALSGLFDIMAHPDLIKKFNFSPPKSLVSLYEETARVFKQAGVCVEVSTAGLRYPAKEIYPSPNFLKVAFRYGVPVTLGSDAHHPDQVGAGFSQALALVKEVGYKEIILFSRRTGIAREI